MHRATIKNQFLREFRELSPAGRGEVSKYAVWILSMEKRERLAELRDRNSARQVVAPILAGKAKDRF